MRTLHCLAPLLLILAGAAAAAAEAVPLDKDLWEFKDEQLVFKPGVPPESAGPRCIEWKDYVWRISAERIELRDTRKDGAALSAERHGRGEDGAPLSDKDWMKELAERAKDARKANEQARKAAEKAREEAEKQQERATETARDAQRREELNTSGWNSPYYPPPWLMHRPLSQGDALGRGWDYYLRNPDVRDYRYYRPYQDLYLYGERTRDAERARQAWAEAKKKEDEKDQKAKKSKKDRKEAKDAPAETK